MCVFMKIERFFIHKTLYKNVYVFMKMSIELDSNPIKLARLIDPNVNVGSTRKYGVLETALRSDYKHFPSQTYSDNSISFTIYTPGIEVAVDRHMMVQTKFRIEVNAPSNVGTNLYTKLFTPTGSTAVIGLRQFPLASCCTNIQMTMDNVSFNNRPFHTVTPLTWYSLWSLDDNLLSGSPSQKDQVNDYNIYGSGGASLSPRNPLIHYYSSDAYNTTRGAFVVDYNPAPTDNLTQAIFYVTVIEPLFVTPAVLPGENQPAIVGASNINITMTLASLNRVLSIANTLLTAEVSGAYTYNVTISGAPELLVRYLSLKDKAEIPQQSVWGYYEITDYATNNSPGTNPRDPFTITSNNTQLQSLPKSFYVFCRPADNARTALTADYFFTLDSINVTLNNQTGLMSGANSYQLFQIARRNGCNMSWYQWARVMGSVFCFTLADTGSMDPNLAPGVQGNYNLQVTATFINQTADPISTAVEMYIVLVYDATLVYVKGSGFTQRKGLLTEKDVEESFMLQDTIDWEAQGNVYGGSLFSKLKGFYEKARDKARDFVKPFGKELGAIADIAENIPVAQTGVKIGRKFLGVGGARLTRDMLRDA